MKILITTDVYKPLVNGVVTSMVNLSEELQKKGHDVRILTLSNDRNSYKVGNVYYLRSIPVRFYPDLRGTVYYKSRFITEILDWKPDIIHTQCEFFSYMFADKISKKLGVPIVHTYHTLYEQYADYILKNRKISGKMIAHFSKIRLKDADVVIAPTYKVLGSLTRYGLKNKTAVIPTGIDTKKFSFVLPEDEKIKLKQQWNIPLENKVLINIGRIGFEKSIDQIIYNFSELAQQNDKLTLCIVGDGPARESLEELVKMLNVEDKVVFTGMIPQADVQKYYQLGDIFVCASTSETQGLTYIEAMANGLPLVCQKDDCLQGVLFEGENGFYFNECSEFVSAVQRLMGDDKLVQKSREFNKNLIKTFSKEQFADNVENLYTEVIEDNNIDAHLETEHDDNDNENTYRFFTFVKEKMVMIRKRGLI